MEDIVKQAMAKWPNVPACYGWLGLDARGNWYLRDAQTQACGAFASGHPGARGARLERAPLLAFIGRNYEADPRGCWFFQNGPQRVFVELEVAPWIWRVDDAGSVQTHTGQPAQVKDILLDASGRVFIKTNLGLGLVHTQDVGRVANLIERRNQPLLQVDASQLPAKFGFVLSPQAHHAAAS